MELATSNEDLGWGNVFEEELALGSSKEPESKNRIGCKLASMARNSEGEWEDAFFEEVKDSRQESQDVEDACQLTPESGSESSDEESSHSSSCPKLTSWWAQRLFRVVKSLGLEWNRRDQRKPLQVISACCGCSAESAVLQARPAMLCKCILGKK